MFLWLRKSFRVSTNWRSPCFTRLVSSALFCSIDLLSLSAYARFSSQVAFDALRAGSSLVKDVLKLYSSSCIRFILQPSWLIPEQGPQDSVLQSTHQKQMLLPQVSHKVKGFSPDHTLLVLAYKAC